MTFRDKILITIGESAGTVFGMAVILGLLTSLLRYLSTKVLKRMGIDYFAEMAESYRWIGQTMIESRAMFNADRACYYRCSNGKSYIEDSEIKTNKDIKVYSIVNVTRNKGLNPLPETLDKQYFELFIKIQEQENFLQYFAQDLNVLSQVRNELKKYDVVAYMSIKIKFADDLYGIILYTWSDVNSIPKNLLSKHREYLDDIKNSVIYETAFIISRTMKFKIYELTNREEVK